MIAGEKGFVDASPVPAVSNFAGERMIPVAKPLIGEPERKAVDRVLLSGALAQGSEVAAFEFEFTQAVTPEFESIAVNSGTSALHLLLLAHGIGPGDEVIVPSFTFAATANSVALTGATPIFVDIDPRYFCVSTDAVSSAITSRTQAVMPVHLYGHPADMRELTRICNERGLLLLEDAAQAHGAAINKRNVGTWAQGGAFSFYPTKNMTAGEGGMVTIADPAIARTVRLLRNQGQERRYENEIVGFNNRMTDIHAAIGRVQLIRLAEWNAKRRANAEFFDRSLSGVVTPQVASYATHVYHQYTIRVVDLDRDRFATELASRGVDSGVYYPIPNHRLPSYARTEYLPETERAAREVLSLPIYPSLTEGELEHIANAVNSVARVGA